LVVVVVVELIQQGQYYHNRTVAKVAVAMVHLLKNQVLIRHHSLVEQILMLWLTLVVAVVALAKTAKTQTATPHLAAERLVRVVQVLLLFATQFKGKEYELRTS
jgi:TRAP-type uncharacterized transport system fused permease subunit